MASGWIQPDGLPVWPSRPLARHYGFGGSLLCGTRLEGEQHRSDTGTDWTQTLTSIWRLEKTKQSLLVM